MLIGTEGALLIPLGYPPQLLPEERFKGVSLPSLPPRNHYHHFVDACLGGEKTESHFAQTGPMTEAILLGTVAIRVPGQKLEWDSPRMRVTNSTDANRYLHRKYRDRALLLATSRCGFYCRFCFRRGTPPGKTREPDDAALEDIRRVAEYGILTRATR